MQATRALQLILEQQEFELCDYTYTWIFFPVKIVPLLCFYESLNYKLWGKVCLIGDHSICNQKN